MILQSAGLSDGKASFNPTLSLFCCRTNADLALADSTANLTLGKIVSRVDPWISKAERYLLELFQGARDEIGGTPCQVAILHDKTIKTIVQILACPRTERASHQIADVTKQPEKPFSTGSTVFIPIRLNS